MWNNTNIDKVESSVKDKAKALAAKAMSPPTPKEIVEIFCGAIKEEVKRNLLGAVIETKRSCSCPKGKNCRDYNKHKGMLIFSGNSGFTNP